MSRVRRGRNPNDAFLITTIIVMFAIFLTVLLKGFRFGRSNSLMYLYYDEGDEGNNSSEPIIEYLSNNENENVTKAKSAADFLYSKDSGDRIVEFYNPVSLYVVLVYVPFTYELFFCLSRWYITQLI